MTTQGRRSRQDVDIETAIQLLAEEGYDAAAIRRELEARPALVGRVPTLRTVQRIVKRMRARDQSTPWSLTDDETGDPRLVLDTLAAVVRTTQGRIVTITRGEARHLPRLKAAAPDLELMSLWRLARLYASREIENVPTLDLDLMLAFSPWYGNPAESSDEWLEAFKRGWVPSPLATALAGVALGSKSGSELFDLPDDGLVKDQVWKLWEWTRRQEGLPPV